MAMREQAISIDLKPMNQQAPQSAGPMGRLARIQNGIAKKFLPGKLRVSKRPAFNPLSNVVRNGNATPILPLGARWLAQFQGQLIGQFSAQVFPYSAEDQTWQGRYSSNPIGWQMLTQRPVFNSNTRAQAGDSATVGGRTLFAFRTAVGSTQAGHLIMQDSEGTVLGITAFATGDFRIKVVSDGVQFWVFSQATAMTSTFVQVISTAGIVLATATIAWGAARDRWDVRYAPGAGQVVLATPIGGGTTDLHFMTYAGGIITTNVHATPAADCTNGVGFLDNTGGTNVYIAGADGANGVRGFEVSSAGALTFTFPIDTANTDYVGSITGYAQPGGISAAYVVVAYSVLRDNTTLPSTVALNNQTRVFVCDRTPTVIPIQVARSLVLASRAFIDDQGNYYAVMYYQSTASSITADVTPNTAQPSYFVLFLANQVTGGSNIVGQFDYGFAAMLFASRNSADFYPWHLPSAAIDENGALHIALSYLGEQQESQGTFSAFTGIVDYIVSPRAGRPIDTTDELLIPGLQGTRFDGSIVVEDGIALAPEFPNTGSNPLPSGPGGNMNTAEQYWIAAVYEWLDNAGNVVQSIPSQVVGPISLGAGNKTLTSTWSTLRVSNKTGVRISYYRTFSPTSGGNTAGIILRKVGEVANDPTVDTVDFIDTFSDFIASIGENMYTQPLDISSPRALTYYPCPAFSRACVADGRRFVIGYDNAIWFSMQRTEGFGAPFNPQFRIVLPTTANAVNLVPMDARIVVLCDDGTAWTFPISGLPNPTLTTGSIPQPEQLPFTTGSTGAALMTPAGAVYSAEHGPWLMDRSLSSQFIGAPVQDEITEHLNVIDIAVDDAQRLYLSMGFFGTGGNADEILVYDQISQCWYIWFAPVDVLTAASWNGRYVFADTEQNVWMLDRDDDSTFADAGNMAIPSVYEVASLAFGGVNGYESCWQVQLYGQYAGPHNLKIDVKFDQAEVISQTLTQPVLADPGIYRYEILPNRVDCQALGLVFSDDFTGIATPGDSFALEAFDVLVGVESGLGRIPPTTRRIAP